MSETWVTLDCGWLHDKRAEPQMRPTDDKRIQEMLYGLPNTQPVYTQLGTTTVDLDEMRAEITRLQAREAKLREALDGATSLLKEWRETPFFSTPEEWERWVDEFGHRVDVFLARAALREEGA
jgi:hypothetical protein